MEVLSKKLREVRKMENSFEKDMMIEDVIEFVDSHKKGKKINQN